MPVASLLRCDNAAPQFTHPTSCREPPPSPTTALSVQGCAEHNRQRDGVQVGNRAIVGTGMNVTAVLLDSSLSSIEEPASTTTTFSLRALVETTTVVYAPAFRPSTVSVAELFS